VDDQVPTYTYKFHSGFNFASTNDGHDIWPILMEKGFAKVFGSYWAIRGGRGFESFKAVTQAPVDIYEASVSKRNTLEWKSPYSLWRVMEDAHKNKFPMTGGTIENSLGIVDGHEFAIVGVGSHPKYGKTVEVYNPWARNEYAGKLKVDNGDKVGGYNLTFEEFIQAFDGIQVARVRKGWKISSKRVPVGKPVALRFKVSGTRPFAVQLEWPHGRFFEAHGCPRKRHDIMRLMVSPQAESRSVKHAEQRRHSLVSNLRVDMQGPGDYLVYIYSSYDGSPWVEEIVVNVYANETISFTELKDPLAVGREMLGFKCKDIKVPGIISWTDDDFRALDHPINGYPAWQLFSVLDKKKVIWVNNTGQLHLSKSEEELDMCFDDFDTSKLECADNFPSKAQKAKEVSASLSRCAEVKTTCDFVVGEQVLHRDDRENWICSEVEAISRELVKVRFLLTGTKRLRCDSENLRKVAQCGYQVGDHVRYRDGDNWTSAVDEVVKEVDCDALTLSGGWRLPCISTRLMYPDGCPFHKGEKVLVRRFAHDPWTMSKVKKVEVWGHNVFVEHTNTTGKTETTKCHDRVRLKKLSRCDKVSQEQLARFRKLNNYEEIMAGKEDSVFRPDISSIGPVGADCGDAAAGGEPEPCENFNTWGTITDVLGLRRFGS